MYELQHLRWVVLMALALLVAACGQADPAFAPAASDTSLFESATPATIATPITTLATPAGTPAAPHTAEATSADWINLPADFAVRTVAQAEAMALDLAPTTFNASHPHVARVWLLTQREMAQGTDQVLGEGGDPLALIWWVDLDNDDYAIPRCPAPPAGTTPKNCGSAPLAAFQFFASDGQNLGLTVGRNFTPATESGDITLPATARLLSQGEAIAAALQSVHSADGGSLHVTDVRSLSLRQWLREQAEQGVVPNVPLAPDAPLWEVSLTNAAYTTPCILQDTSKCVLFNVSQALDAISGDQLMYYGRPATPTP